MQPGYAVKAPLVPTTRPNPAANGWISHRAALVQPFALFAGIPLIDCAQIVASAQERQFVQRKTLFFEGDPIQHVVLVLSGCIKVTQLSPNGQEVILRLNGPGEMVGALGSSSKFGHCSTARTVEPSAVLIWETNHFEAIGERFPLLRRNAARILEQRLNEMDVRFREVSTEKVAPRLSSQLVRLLKQVGKHADGHVKIALSRRDLAQLTGTTLFTVSRLLSYWETRGIVTARREEVLVRDLPALVGLSRES